MKTIQIIAASMLTLSAFSVGAETLTTPSGVTAEIIRTGDQAEILLSYEPDQAKASSLSFELMVPDQFTGTDDSLCLAELPVGISGGCRFVDGRLKVIIYNPQNEAIQPAIMGRVSLLRVSEADFGSEGRRELGAPGRSRSSIGADGMDSDQAFKLANVDLGVPKR